MFWKRLSAAFWSLGMVLAIEMIRDQIRERRRRKIQEEYRARFTSRWREPSLPEDRYN